MEPVRTRGLFKLYIYIYLYYDLMCDYFIHQCSDDDRMANGKDFFFIIIYRDGSETTTVSVFFAVVAVARVRGETPPGPMRNFMTIFGICCFVRGADTRGGVQANSTTNIYVFHIIKLDFLISYRTYTLEQWLMIKSVHGERTFYNMYKLIWIVQAPK